MLFKNQDKGLCVLKLFTITLLLLSYAQSNTKLENTACKKCHPVIFSEYQSSMHAKASPFKDPIHNAVWQRHPDNKSGHYRCAKCHTPADHLLAAKRAPLTDNAIQRDEPISCQSCHRIESIEKHAKANRNILHPKEKYFFSADKNRKGLKIEFKKESLMFGLATRVSGSPYHDIDYSNENFYNGNLCMGCHSHKQNSKGFTVCDLEVKQGDSKANCISCHMPQTKGSLANQKQSGTHAFHGANIHQGIPKHLSQYIKLSLAKYTQGFDIAVKNEVTHTLFPQPLRLNRLRVTIERGDTHIDLKPTDFRRVIGTDGKPSMPWLADTLLEDTTIKAGETRKIHYDTLLQKGDSVVVEFGYYIVHPKAAKKLALPDPEFIVLTTKRFDIQ